VGIKNELFVLEDKRKEISPLSKNILVRGFLQLFQQIRN
jgi:hypothetical protein